MVTEAAHGGWNNTTEIMKSYLKELTLHKNILNWKQKLALLTGHHDPYHCSRCGISAPDKIKKFCSKCDIA